jgi:hypothetical protein
MKTRILIFCLVGPAISCVVLAILGGSSDAFAAAPIICVIELAPFLLCALIDFFLEKARLWERLVVAVTAGFVSSFIAALAIGAMSQKFQSLRIGLVGAIPAMFCSLLAGKSNVDRARQTL